MSIFQYSSRLWWLQKQNKTKNNNKNYYSKRHTQMKRKIYTQHLEEKRKDEKQKQKQKKRMN